MTPKERAVVSIQNESETISSLSMMRTAMQQALEALEDELEADTCEEFAASAEKCHEAIAALREALAEPQITTPDVCGEVCARAKLCYGCNKDLEEANAKFAEQVEQSQFADASLEPVSLPCCGYHDASAIMWNKFNGVVQCHNCGQIYAAPVRTKDHCNPLQDLTEEEIEAIVDSVGAHEVGYWQHVFARAVIAADRAKNNLCERTK